MSTLLLATGIHCTVRGHAQTADGPAFDVVSVKAAGSSSTPALPGEKVWGLVRPIRYSGSRITGSQTLKHLIQYAYSLEDWAVEGPVGFNQELFEFTAVMPAETSPETAKLMFRRMLAERLGLKFHMVRREVPVYALVEARQGVKLRPLPEGPEKPLLEFLPKRL